MQRPTETDNMHTADRAPCSAVSNTESAFGVCASARGIAVAVTPGNNGGPAPPRALPVPRSAAAPQPLCAQGRHHAWRDSWQHDLGHFGTPGNASHVARGDHHSDRRDQPQLTVCTGGKSHPQNCPAAAPAELDIDSGASGTRSEEGRFCPVSGPYVVTTSATAGHASSPH